jgi:hypothetical protein
MKPHEIVALWIHDEAAKRILALTSHHPFSRWVIIGVVIDTQTVPVGLWVNVTYFEERRPQPGGQPDKKVHYAVTPTECLIRWDDVYVAQKLAKAPEPPADLRPEPGLYL